MKRIGLGAQGVVRFGDPYSQDDQSSAGSKSYPPVRSPFQLRALLVNTFNDAQDLEQDLSQCFTQFRIVSVWHEFSRVDVPNPEEHVSEFMLNTGSAA